MTLQAPFQSGRLAQLGALRFVGPDSLSFLQGQISNDTRRLAQGQSLFAAYSSPQGRVLALMHLLPHSSGVIAIMPRELLAPTLEGLRKFVLRAKVKIEDAGADLDVAGHHGTQQIQSTGIGVPDSIAGYLETDGIGVAAVNGDPTRYWVIGSAEQLAARALAGAAFAADRIEHDWRLADTRAGLPQVYASTREAFVAQMLNLDLLDGISFSKGCYTGQEIIARTQHLGRIKRRLYRLQLPDGDWHIGQPLHLTNGRTGRLIEIAQSGEGYEALAVLSVDAGKLDAGKPAADANDEEAASAATIGAAELPLPYPM
jgi:folate-binding protein YgfZ